MTQSELKDMIRASATLIADYLVFELQKKVELNGSVASGSAYIYFDEMKVRISDHNLKGNHHYFIDVRKFSTPLLCLTYFIETCINDRKIELGNFCRKIVKQEDCPPEFLDLVNKEFWNMI